MLRPRTYFLLSLALLVLCFGIAARMEPEYQAWPGSRTDGDVFKVVLGTSRAMFANQFYVKADEYYHSGYYPSIFENRSAFVTPHMAADTGAVKSNNQGEDEGFRGPPLDRLEAFGRHFFPNRHTHLDEGGAGGELSNTDEIGEILPWLKLSIDLDPHNVDTYVVTAFWLRSKMGKPREAEKVLREGLRNNPKNPEVLFELGRLYFENDHYVVRARNVWEAAAALWRAEPEGPSKDDPILYEKITTRLAELEKNERNISAAVKWLQEAQTVSQAPQVLQKQIEELKAQTNAPAIKPH